MRIRVLQTPSFELVDGIDLSHFVPGQKYEVGPAIGALMLAEGWAEPLDSNEPVPAPFADHDPFGTHTTERQPLPNLIRETHPPSADAITMAADFERRRRRRGTPSRD